MRNQHRHLSRRRSEQLLAGRAVHDVLAPLLDAARTSDAVQDLPGEFAAVAAFHAAESPTSVPNDRSHTVRSFLTTRTLVTKLTVAAAATVAVAGVAAAASGALPLGAAGISLAGSTSQHALGAAAGSPGTPSSWPVGSASPSAPPSVGLGAAGEHRLVGACVVWLHRKHPVVHVKPIRPAASSTIAVKNPSAGPTKTPAKKGHAPKHHFGALIKAAGGRDKVTAYCTNLLKNLPKPVVHPAKAPGTSNPAAGPGTHAPGKPSTRPTGVPPTKPFGGPVSVAPITGGPLKS